MSQPSSKPQTVVVTGASAGIGRAIAVEFARHGANVALIARGRAGLEAAKVEVESAGGRAMIIEADVADAQAIESAATQIEAELGQIDVWVNNAMTSVFSPVKEMTAEDYRRVTEVTYLGYVHGTLSALRRMLPRDRGHIVQVGSALAYRGIPLQSAYCGAKHAIEGFSDSLHAELVHDRSHVKLSEVHMPAVNTPQFGWVKSRLPNKAQPVPPIYQPEVAARAVYFVTRNYRRTLIVGGMNNIIVWGNKFLPGFGDWYLGKTGYSGQQTEKPRDPDRPHNLHEPVDANRDHGMHGDFDQRSKPRSTQMALTRNREKVGLALMGVAALGAMLWRRA